MIHRRPVNLDVVKETLTQFAADRADSPPQKVEEEFGDLLLYLVSLADKAGVDLIEAGQKRIERGAETLPRIVPNSGR
jgi:NTP pyrophosphatase (non-canonical NTP hydrolase)